MCVCVCVCVCVCYRLCLYELVTLKSLSWKHIHCIITYALIL